MHIHIVAIAGSMTAPLAIALKKEGHQVTGSDQEKTYPPFSLELKDSKIPINTTPISSKIDLAIIGSSYQSFHQTREEYRQIKSQKIPHISATKYISQKLIKKNSILIAGTYGKTTISAALAFLLTKANFDPSYMFGGKSLNHLDSLHFSKSDWSVVEADESINGCDTKAKFLYYPVKYLILTSALWEHKDSYQSQSENFSAFKKLVQNLPQDGCLIYNQNEASILPLLPFAKCQKIPYDKTEIANNLIGKYNQNNLSAVETLAKIINIDPNDISTSFKEFIGVEKRLEVKSKLNNIIFIDDFAQSSARIKASLQAIKDSYPLSKIKVLFEAHASFGQYRSNLIELSDAFKVANEIVISRLRYCLKIKSQDRLTAKDFLSTISHSLYIPLSEDIIKHYKNTLEPGDILVHFSSGGSEGINVFNQIIRLFNKN